MEVLELSLDGEVNNFQIAHTIDIKDGQRHFEKIDIGTLSCSYSRQGSANYRRNGRLRGLAGFLEIPTEIRGLPRL